MFLHQVTRIFPRAKDVCFTRLFVCSFFEGRQRAPFVKNNLNKVQLVLPQCCQLKTTADKTERKKQFYEDCSWKYWASSFHVFFSSGNMLDCNQHFKDKIILCQVDSGNLYSYISLREPESCLIASILTHNVCYICSSLIQSVLGSRRLMLWMTSLYSLFFILNLLHTFDQSFYVIHIFIFMQEFIQLYMSLMFQIIFMFSLHICLLSVVTCALVLSIIQFLASEQSRSLSTVSLIPTPRIYPHSFPFLTSLEEKRL